MILAPTHACAMGVGMVSFSPRYKWVGLLLRWSRPPRLLRPVPWGATWCSRGSTLLPVVRLFTTSLKMHCQATFPFTALQFWALLTQVRTGQMPRLSANLFVKDNVNMTLNFKPMFLPPLFTSRHKSCWHLNSPHECSTSCLRRCIKVTIMVSRSNSPCYEAAAIQALRRRD